MTRTGRPTATGRATAAALVGLLLLAGCSTVGVGGGDATLTPAPVPESTPGALLGAGGGSDDAAAPLVLAGAHPAALGDRYVLRTVWTVRSANGTLLTSVDQRVRSGPDAFRARFRLRGRPGFLTNGGGMTAAFWTNGSVLVGRTRTDAGTDYRYLERGAAGRSADFYRSLRRPKPWRDQRALFEAAETRVADRWETPDGTRHVVVGNRIESPGAFATATGVEHPRNVSLRAVVDDRGVVRDLRLRYAGVHPFRGRVVVRRNVSYRAVGRVESVRRPAWVDRAVADARSDRWRHDGDRDTDGHDSDSTDDDNEGDSTVTTAATTTRRGIE